MAGVGVVDGVDEDALGVVWRTEDVDRLATHRQHEEVAVLGVRAGDAAQGITQELERDATFLLDERVEQAQTALDVFVGRRVDEPTREHLFAAGAEPALVACEA